MDVDPTHKDPLETTSLSDQSLSADASMFRGLYFGDKLPGIQNIVTDTSIFPKASRTLNHLVVGFSGVGVKTKIDDLLKKLGRYVEYEGVKTALIYTDSNDKLLNVYKWALFSGAPLALDINNRILIHDDPRKLQLTIKDSYNVTTNYFLKLGIVHPFHNWVIADDHLRRNVTYRKEKIRLSICGRTVTTYERCVKVILAPTASGKSYWLERNKNFRDADKFLTWPLMLGWWNDPILSKQVNQSLWDQISKLDPEFIYLYNGDVSVLSDSSRIEIIGIVIVPMHIHMRNLDYRRSDPKDSQPKETDIVLRNRLQLIEYAKSNDIKIYNGFNSMRSRLVKYYYNRLLTYHVYYDSLYINSTIREIICPDYMLLVPKRPHPLGCIIIDLYYNSELYMLAKEGGSTPLLAYIKEGQNVTATMNEICSKIFVDFKVPDLRYDTKGEGAFKTLRASLNVSKLPETKGIWNWTKNNYGNSYNERLSDTFGTHISYRIHNNVIAMAAKITDRIWKHMTRFVPQIVVFNMLGYKYDIVKDENGCIVSIKVDGVCINPSGHMMNGLTWLATPNLSLLGSPLIYPDFYTFVTDYLSDQHRSYGSIEQHDKEVAFHRFHETAAGVLGSYVAIKLLLKGGVSIKKRDFILWRLYCRKILRSIVINSRTNYLNINSSRDDDQRFGMI